MNQVLNNIVSIVIMNGLVMVIPGPNFLIVARQSVLNGLLAGICCAFGITAAITLHAILAVCSVSFFITRYPLVFTMIRYIGAGYLFFLGTSFLIAFFKNTSMPLKFDSLNTKNKEAFCSGFLVDIFNPFVSVFYISLFSALSFKGASIFELCCYIDIIFIITIVWFSMVAGFFNNSVWKEYLKNKSRYIQALSGFVMYYFSTKMIFGF